MKNLWRGIVLAFCVALTGCEIEPETDALDSQEEEVGEARDAFTGWTSLTQVSGSTSTPVGSGTQAFLSGIGGNLDKAASGVEPYVSTWVGGLPPFGPRFFLSAVPTNGGATLGATANAVYTGSVAYPESPRFTGPGGGCQTQAIDHPTNGDPYACFLTTVYDPDDSSYASWDSSCYVVYLPQPHVKCCNSGSARARCIPVSYSYGSAIGGSQWAPTLTYLGPEDSANGKVCGLHGVSGTFRSNDQNSGVAVYIDNAQSPPGWYLKTSAGKGAHATCVH